MPVVPKNANQLYQAQVDAHFVPKPVFENPVTIDMEIPDVIPPNFDQLSPEEQERIKDRLRFRGIRLDPTLTDQTVPLTRETLDIP